MKAISSYRQMYEKDPIFVRQLRTFREVGIVSYQNWTQEAGRAAIFLGYTKYHSDVVYRFVDLETTGLLKTRHILWLNQTYGEYKGIVPRPKVITIPDDEEQMDTTVGETRIMNDMIELLEPEWTEESEPPAHINSEAGRDDAEEDKQSKPPSRELRRLQTFFNPNPLEHSPEDDDEIASD
jgi:hypothetical protein